MKSLAHRLTLRRVTTYEAAKSAIHRNPMVGPPFQILQAAKGLLAIRQPLRTTNRPDRITKPRTYRGVGAARLREDLIVLIGRPGPLLSCSTFRSTQVRFASSRLARE